MYLYCEKDYNTFTFNFQANTIYPICSVDESSIGYICKDGTRVTISKQFLKRIRQFVKMKTDRYCDHKGAVNVLYYKICPECEEVISYKKYW